MLRHNAQRKRSVWTFLLMVLFLNLADLQKLLFIIWAINVLRLACE